MAKAEVRVIFDFECTVCKNRNYASTKNKRNDPERISRNKFCPTCRKHTAHRETR